MAKIERIALTKLLKLELPQFIVKVTAIVEKHNPKTLKLENSVELLHRQCDKMKLLEVPYGPHPLTQRIYKLNIKRLEHAAAISMQVNMHKKLDIPDKRELVSIAYPAVRDHLHYLRQNNQPTIDRIIDLFFNYLRDNPEVQNALERLELNYNLQELQKANNEHYKLSLIRSEEISQRPKSVSVAIQKEAQYILRAVFEQINFYQFSYENVDYSQLISELNRLIARFKGLVNTRASRGKTRKEKTHIENRKKETATESLSKTASTKVNKERSTKEKELFKKYVNTITSSVIEEETQKNVPLQGLIRILKLPSKNNGHSSGVGV
ncbi:MAG TPA: DUF6261 family protein [Dysgonamonadaceae bacterium]|nr:DUF6261 family protein [Dysgonamonadaceae bacterium]